MDAVPLSPDQKLPFAGGLFGLGLVLCCVLTPPAAKAGQVMIAASLPFAIIAGLDRKNSITRRVMAWMIALLSGFLTVMELMR